MGENDNWIKKYRRQVRTTRLQLLNTMLFILLLFVVSCLSVQWMYSTKISNVVRTFETNVYFFQMHSMIQEWSIAYISSFLLFIKLMETTIVWRNEWSSFCPMNKYVGWICFFTLVAVWNVVFLLLLFSLCFFVGMFHSLFVCEFVNFQRCCCCCCCC